MISMIKLCANVWLGWDSILPIGSSSARNFFHFFMFLFSCSWFSILRLQPRGQGPPDPELLIHLPELFCKSRRWDFFWVKLNTIILHIAIWAATISDRQLFSIHSNNLRRRCRLKCGRRIYAFFRSKSTSNVTIKMAPVSETYSSNKLSICHRSILIYQRRACNYQRVSYHRSQKISEWLSFVMYPKIIKWSILKVTEKCVR